MYRPPDRHVERASSFSKPPFYEPPSRTVTVKREDKEKMVEELREGLSTAASVVVASNAGMSVNSINELRASMRKAGVTYRVVKNTLAKRAIEGTNLENLGELLSGPSAIAFHPEEPAAPAKAILDFKKKNEKFEVKGGWSGGTLFDAKGVEDLSKMASKDDLRASLLALFNAVGTKFVRTLAAAPQQFVQVLAARKDSIGE